MIKEIVLWFHPLTTYSTILALKVLGLTSISWMALLMFPVVLLCLAVFTAMVIAVGIAGGHEWAIKAEEKLKSHTDNTKR